MMPKDPVMLLSYVNTQLRDFYPSLAEFCAAMQTDESDLREKLALIDYDNDEKTNQFVKEKPSPEKNGGKRRSVCGKNTYGAPFLRKACFL